jgi:hypothetical protein
MYHTHDPKTLESFAHMYGFDSKFPNPTKFHKLFPYKIISHKQLEYVTTSAEIPFVILWTFHKFNFPLQVGASKFHILCFIPWGGVFVGKELRTWMTLPMVNIVTLPMVSVITSNLKPWVSPLVTKE